MILPTWGTVSGISWAPNGLTLGYEIADSDSLATGIKGISTQGLFEVSYAVSSMYGYRFDWSPDGTKLVFVVSSGDQQCLALTDFRRDETAFPAADIISPVSGQTVTARVFITFLLATT